MIMLRKILMWKLLALTKTLTLKKNNCIPCNKGQSFIGCQEFKIVQKFTEDVKLVKRTLTENAF